MYPAITERQGVCDGDPCLAGTRIMMSHFQKLVEMGWSHEKILVAYPHIDRGTFYEAMSRWMNTTNWRD